MSLAEQLKVEVVGKICRNLFWSEMLWNINTSLAHEDAINGLVS